MGTPIHLDFSKLKQSSYLKTDPNDEFHKQLQWKGAMVAVIVEHYLFFVLRTVAMPVHPHQIGLPGGNREEDETFPWQTACREFEEETTISAERLEFIACFPTLQSVQRRVYLPFLAKYSASLGAFLQHVVPNEEWERGYLISLPELAESDHWCYSNAKVGDTARPVFFFPLTLIKDQIAVGSADSDISKPPILWGLTARMVWAILRSIGSKG